jgi:hypothetical protein
MNRAHDPFAPPPFSDTEPVIDMSAQFSGETKAPKPRKAKPAAAKPVDLQDALAELEGL